MNIREEVFGYLKNLAVMNVDLSGTRIKDELILPEVNRVDLSEAKGKRLTIRAVFVSYLDLSDGKFGEVVLEGVFNVVDVSGARIGALDRTRAEIWNLDDSEAEIKGVRRKK